MHVLILPIGFILWYVAYDAKPLENDEVTYRWQEENLLKRNRLYNIMNKSI